MDTNENNVNGCRKRTPEDALLSDLAEDVRDHFSIKDIKMNTFKSKIDEYNYHAICTSVIITTDNQMFLGIGDSGICDGYGERLDREDMNRLVDDVQCSAIIDAATQYANSINAPVYTLEEIKYCTTPSALKATLLSNADKNKK